jgi:hypothetical protein
MFRDDTRQAKPKRVKKPAIDGDSFAKVYGTGATIGSVVGLSIAILMQKNIFMYMLVGAGVGLVAGKEIQKRRNISEMDKELNKLKTK